MTVAWIRRAIGLAAAATAVAAVAWWSFGDDGTHTYHAVFEDASELVPRHDVRINDVIVGAVRDVRLDGHRAVVTFTVADDVTLPGGTGAQIRQASLLGDRYLHLVPEGDGALDPGDTIPVDATRRAEGLETVVAAGSELAAGIGAGTVNRFVGAIDRAYVRDPEPLERLLDRAGEAASVLAERGDQVDRTIVRMGELAAAYEPTTDQLAHAVGRAVAGVQVLGDNAEDLTRMTDGLAELSRGLSVLLTDHREQLLRVGGTLTTVLGEVVASLEQIDRGIDALYDFNASWACIGSGHYINQTFALLPETATIQYGPGRCDPETGPRGRDTGSQIVVDPASRAERARWLERTGPAPEPGR